MAKLTLAAVQALFKEQTEELMKEITSLRDEVPSLRAHIAATQSQAQDSQDSSHTTRHASKDPRSFADVVRTSVQSALQEENVKKEMVIRMPENE